MMTTKKEYCLKELDLADDKKKGLERDIADQEKAIAEEEEGVTTVAEEIKALEADITALDKQVAEATEQRKQENKEYQDLMAGNSAAKELILFAKNRMQKFYNPKLYKPPPKRELSEEERITLNMGGTLAPTNPPAFLQIRSKVGSKDDNMAPPGPPPEAPGKFKKKGEESGGVIAMMDMMKADVEKETQEAEFQEKDSQGEYEQMVLDAAAKRTADKKSIEEKVSQKAEVEAELIKAEDSKKVETSELMATKEYISELHSDCDWLLEKYDIRKEARANEIDALKKAVAVLSGADYSLIQVGHNSHRQQ